MKRVARRLIPVLCFLGILGWARQPAEAAGKPNVVLIILDDMGYGDTTLYGDSDLKTPALEAIAKQGLKFTQFRVNPLCAPTRASIMTGLYSLECGMWRGPGADSKGDEPAGGWPANARRIRDDIQLLPQLLHQAGYATGLFGKWHLGEDPKNLPNSRGIDEFVGFLGGAHPYSLDRRSRVLVNDQPYSGGGHTTDVFADAAIDFIRLNKDKPFFCYLPFNAVHGPLRSEKRPADSGTPEWLAKYEQGGVAQPRRDYCAVLSHADARIADVLETLREIGKENETLVVVLSDNGGILHDFPSNNGPLRGGKGNCYEGGIRVMAVAQWPGVIPSGSISNEPAVHFDLFSTILEATGVAVPSQNGGHPVRGVSLLPHLKSGGNTTLPDRYLFWDLYGSVGALHGPWKMVGEISNHHGKFDKAAAEAAMSTFELYNLNDDLGEKTDLAQVRPEIYRDLKQRHLDWLRQFAK
jgi:arylsulfatase A-like enzyme